MCLQIRFEKKIIHVYQINRKQSSQEKQTADKKPTAFISAIKEGSPRTLGIELPQLLKRGDET